MDLWRTEDAKRARRTVVDEAWPNVYVNIGRGHFVRVTHADAYKLITSGDYKVLGNDVECYLEPLI